MTRMRALSLHGLLASSLVMYLLCASAATQAKPLEHAAQIRELSAVDAAKGQPVHLRGVVTYYDPLAPDLFVQDETAGIYVACDAPARIARGQQVEITGVTGPGDFAPVVLHPQIHILGPGKLPKAIHLSVEQLL